MIAVAIAVTRIDLDVGQLNYILRADHGMVGVFIGRKGRQVATLARALAPKDTMALAASINSTKIRYAGRAAARVGSALPYARYPHDGTGVYGPFGRPIRPRRGKVLVFESGGQTVFARQVMGQRATHYLVRAMRAVI